MLSPEFKEILRQVRECFVTLNRTDVCIFGCKDPKIEGPRQYWESSKIVDGKCSKCGKVRWTGSN